MPKTLVSNEVEYTHQWIWDWPWELKSLRDWFYMVSVGEFGEKFLHVRVLGLRSLWIFGGVTLSDGAIVDQPVMLAEDWTPVGPWSLTGDPLRFEKGQGDVQDKGTR